MAAAAQLVALGMPAAALRYLTTDDEEERLMLRAVATRSTEFVDLLQQNLARHISNAMVKARLQ